MVLVAPHGQFFLSLYLCGFDRLQFSSQLDNFPFLVEVSFCLLLQGFLEFCVLLFQLVHLLLYHFLFDLPLN